MRQHFNMGFFENIAKNLAAAAERTQAAKSAAESGREAESVVIAFDRDWEQSWNAIRKDQELNPHALKTSVSIDDQLIEDLFYAIESETPSARIPYTDDEILLDNVGESFRQAEIADFCDGETGEDLGWLCGLLVPEMANEHDRHAVAVYVFRRNLSGSEDEDSKFVFLHAGYLERDTAQFAHPKLLKLMRKDLFLPLKAVIRGGTRDKPNYGIFPYAMSDKIDFED